MISKIEEIFQADSSGWIDTLPMYQRTIVNTLLSDGKSYDDVAQLWLSASADDTYPFSASKPVLDKGGFLSSIKKEVRLYICGDEKYKKERDGLFGDKGVARTYVVSSMAVAISPHLSVASALISPVIALTLASVGKITLSAWCDLK
ncbi:hypothetical protein [Acetobacter senegalensis]|uniref:hypothetical protein n=1 Tax=Acetobacter senegalensis TaxID=446692 RepID=UPI0009EB81EE|nr:hypothetical protein [Acetobacter senegalensis]